MQGSRYVNANLLYTRLTRVALELTTIRSLLTLQHINCRRFI